MNTILVAAVMIALGGCQAKPVDECWSESTKTNLMSLVRKVLLGKIDSVADAQRGSPSTDENRAFFADALSVSIDTYHAVSRNAETGNLGCGANVSMIYRTSSGKAVAARDAAVTFNMYKAEAGSVYAIENTLPLAGLITRAMQDAK